MVSSRILLLALALAAIPCLAAETVLVAPDERMHAGERFLVNVYFNNVSDAVETLRIPGELRARLRGAGLAAELTLTIVDADQAGPVTLPPGGFRKLEYATVVPTGASGPITLDLLELTANRLLLAGIGPGARAIAPSEPAQTASAPIASAPADAAPRDPLGDSFNAPAVLERFDVYEPMYFAVGSRGRTNAKFQFSFRYRLIWDINLGYTQTSLWDLQSASRPFLDSAYKPRVFWYREDLGYRNDWLRRVGLEAGVGHESNGRDGPNSRSINIAYVKPRFTFGDPDGYHLLVAPRVLGYLEKADNPDIDKYRGHVDLTMKLGARDGLLLASEWRRGSRGFRMEIDLSYPLGAITRNRLGGYLQLQYVNGYGESLLDYNLKSPAQFRIGYMLVR